MSITEPLRELDMAIAFPGPDFRTKGRLLPPTPHVVSSPRGPEPDIAIHRRCISTTGGSWRESAKVNFVDDTTYDVRDATVAICEIVEISGGTTQNTFFELYRPWT